MRLKSLELLGFKSFCQPTRIGFNPGITAIVGPNGCGKSNVVDAIRWVLGEQATSRLRGKLAEDLIYAGNESNPPAGMAEVTMLLEAEGSASLPEPYSALSEIAITRRVYRSSESEYSINKIPCRLKDITEFFLAAQIHSRGYALVEQGRIEEIIQARPAEIHAMVEEAAGLALFKGRREISERKLERVRENLARVEDVIAELERQLNYARRQARKAETYKLIRDELSSLERFAAARRIIGQCNELAEQSARDQNIGQRTAELRATATLLQQQSDQAVAELGAGRDQLALKRRELDNLRAAVEERARSRAFVERRLEALGRQAPELQLRLSELDCKATVARAARAFAGARLARVRIYDGGVNEGHLAEFREQYRTAERRLREEEKHAEELKDQLAEVMHEAAAMRGRLGALAGERADIEERLRALDPAVPDHAAELTRCRQLVGDSEMRLELEHARTERAEVVQRETNERELELRTELALDATALAAARDALRTLQARAQRLMPNGAGEKLRLVLNSLNGDRPAHAPAMLLDILKAPPALEPALRAVLGEQLDAVIVDSADFALRAIEILKQHQSGRLCFIPESLPATTSREPIVGAGIAGRLLDMVEIDPRFKQIAEALLGHVVIAEDLRAAFAASAPAGNNAFVTPEGDLLWPHKVISGGSGHHLESSDEIDLRKRAMALEAAERAAAVAEGTHEELVRLDEWARLGCRDSLDDLDSARRCTSGAEARVNQSRSAMAKAEQNLVLAEASCANARRRAAEIATAAGAANSRLEELARLEQEARATLETALAVLLERRNETRELSERMLAVGAQLEARKSALRALEQELSHQRQLVNELEVQIAQYQVDGQRAAADRAEFEREMAALMVQDAAARDDRSRLEGEIESLTRENVTRAQQADSVAAELDEARTVLATLEGELMQCELKCERARTLIEELNRGFREKFQAEFAEVRESLEAALQERDPATDDERLQELRVRAEKLGDVNLAADSEVEELEARTTKLQAERTDLQAAVNDLTHTIQQLNREARKRFLETFEGAAANFAELFPKLLRGGKGRLELSSTSTGDAEAGIDILVQPAGKKVKEIGMLSGGEKALSAMALIFALFLLNPSPFCVMDEVDAPLDEFSLAAFTGLVRELKLNSQFIVITHNQRTMQAADHIHGVTMERPGISRIISLKIPATEAPTISPAAAG